MTARDLDGPQLVGLVRTGQAAQLADRLAALDEGRRKALAAEFTTLATSYEPQWSRPSNPILAAVVAAVGLLPSAAKAATLVSRRNLSWQWMPEPDPALVVRVARERGIAWLGDFALRLAGKLDRQFAGSQWHFVAELLRAEGVPPPTHDRFVGGWLHHLTSRHQYDPRRSDAVPPLVDVLRDDALLDTLVLPALDHDGVAAGGWDGTWRSDPLWLVAVATLVQEGRLARGPLLDGCLAAFTAGRRPSVVRAFTIFHERLAPTVTDVAERRGLYLRLVTDAPGNVASMAQQTLRRLDEAGGLDLDALLDTSRGVLTRPEKGLVKAQLSWLDRVARRHPARSADVAEVVGVALTHPAVDLRDRAASLLGRIGGGPVAVAVAEPAPPAVDLLPEPTPTPMPAPITDVDELTEEVALIDLGPWRTVAVERVLAGVALLRSTDPEGLARALRPVLGRLRQNLRYNNVGLRIRPNISLLLKTVLDSAAGPSEGWTASGRARDSQVTDAGNQPGGPLQAVLARRLAERLLRGRYTGPELASTPTLANGLVDPAVLVERLARAERDGHEFGPSDLLLALYRLPTVIPDDIVEQARRQASPAAARFVAWAEQPPPTPVSTVAFVRRHTPQPWEHTSGYGWSPEVRLHAGLSGAGGGRDPENLFELTIPDRITVLYAYDHYTNADDGVAPLSLAVGVLPAHRDATAAYLLPYLSSTVDMDRRGPGELLPLLADAAGPAGPATRAALACGLGARHDADRVAALDALLLLTAHGPATFDPTAFGADLGRLVADGTLMLSRLLTPLQDAAQTAPVTMWKIVSAALPAMLAMHPAPRGLPDLLTLATQTAPGVGPTVPGLAEVAGRSGSSRLVVEAKRLAARLATKP